MTWLYRCLGNEGKKQSHPSPSCTLVLCRCHNLVPLHHNPWWSVELNENKCHKMRMGDKKNECQRWEPTLISPLSPSDFLSHSLSFSFSFSFSLSLSLSLLFFFLLLVCSRSSCPCSFSLLRSLSRSLSLFFSFLCLQRKERNTNENVIFFCLHQYLAFSINWFIFLITH